VTIADILGTERYEQVRATIARALPLAADRISDRVVDAFIEELQRRGLDGIELLGLPAPKLREAQSYPMYLAKAMHRRVDADYVNKSYEIYNQGMQYQTSPFSLRFVNASRAQVSMMQGRRTAMIEMDMLTGTYAGPEIMYRYENFSYELGGRPHWGLEFDSLTGNNGLLSKLYPKLDQWLAVYKQFNALGTFDNQFTQRMGFESMPTTHR